MEQRHYDHNRQTGAKNRRKKHKKGAKNKYEILFAALFFLIPIIALIIPYIIYRNNFSPVLTPKMLDELSFVRYLVLHGSHDFAEGWISTKPFVPLSTRYFLTYYYTDFSTWKDALLSSVSAVYAIFAVSYLFLVTSLHAKKIYTYIIASIPGVILAVIGLKATYDCGYFLTIVCPFLICAGIIIHGIRFTKFPIPARIAIGALAIIPIIVIIVNMNNYKKSYDFDNTDLLAFELSKPDSSEDVTDKYTGLINYLLTSNLPVSYCTDSIINEITLISDGKVKVAPVVSVEDLSPVNKATDSYENPYAEVSKENKPYIMIYDNKTVSDYSSSHYLAFGEVLYSDSYYTIYTYKNFAYFDDEIFQNNIVDLKNSKYDSFYYSFLGSYISDPQNFPVFSGTNPIFIKPSVKDYENINTLLDIAIQKEGIKNAFFEIDTVALSTGEGLNELDYFDKMVEKYSEVKFYVTLEYPHSSYWKNKDKDTRDKMIATNSEVVKKLSHNDNILFFAPGSEKWLVESHANYNESVPTEEVALSLLITSVCNRKYPVNKDTVTDYENNLKDLADSSLEYPELKDCELIFIGDSIIGNYHGSVSIPGMVNGLSGCESYNLAIGGTSGIGGLNGIVDYMLGTSSSVGMDAPEFEAEMKRFKEENDPNKQKVFIINYGVNDYFSGVPARAGSGIPYEDNAYDSYESGMRAGIEKIKAAYPDAKICIISPIYTNYFLSGTEIKSNVGSPLNTYREVGRSLAEEMGLMYLNSTEKIEINEKNYTTYLVDGVHPTNEGLYLIGNTIIRFLKEQMEN